jgi:predicted ATPase
MVGRDQTVQEISDQLKTERFVTITGPGGIGKTTVAVAVGYKPLADFAGAVHFFDLGPLNDPLLVPSAVASALGLIVQSNDPVPGLMAFLRDKRMLLILDSCEHVIETAAALAERIFEDAPQVHILATSREPLRVEGERVHWLAHPMTPVSLRRRRSASRRCSFSWSARLPAGAVLS